MSQRMSAGLGLDDLRAAATALLYRVRRTVRNRAWHGGALQFPDHWDGTISVDDTCRAHNSSRPEQCGIGQMVEHQVTDGLVVFAVPAAAGMPADWAITW